MGEQPNPWDHSGGGVLQCMKRLVMPAYLEWLEEGILGSKSDREDTSSGHH